MPLRAYAPEAYASASFATAARRRTLVEPSRSANWRIRYGRHGAPLAKTVLGALRLRLSFCGLVYIVYQEVQYKDNCYLVSMYQLRMSVNRSEGWIIVSSSIPLTFFGTL